LVPPTLYWPEKYREVPNPPPRLILEKDIGELLSVVVADDRKHHSVTAITELNDRVV
jgi:hypothetical protein